MDSNIVSTNDESAGRHRVGAVRFFNARPLTYGLEKRPDIELQLKEPAQLGEALVEGTIEVGMVPSIDYQLCQKELTIIPVGAIGSREEVLTVRVFSQIPLEEIDHLACDTSSHTSVVLVQIIWQLCYGRKLTVEPLKNDIQSEAAILLIGDKVIPQLGQWRYELDLGRAWSKLTELPFVYAVWAVLAGTQTDELTNILLGASRQGQRNIDDIVNCFAGGHGFDHELGHKYFTDNIIFDFGPAQQQALKHFYQLAFQMGLIPELRPLRLAEVTVGSESHN